MSLIHFQQLRFLLSGLMSGLSLSALNTKKELFLVISQGNVNYVLLIEKLYYNVCVCVCVRA